MLHDIQVSPDKMKYVPATMQGLNYGFGEWILETNEQDKPVSVGVPSLQGTWPMIDLCKRYALVVFTKELSGDQKKDVYMNLKGIVDDGITGACN